MIEEVHPHPECLPHSRVCESQFSILSMKFFMLSVKLSETVQKKNPFIVWLPTIARNRHVTKLIQNIFF
jgi:hypothetical protein